MTRRRALSAGLLATILAVPAYGTPPLVDHHVHLLSPRLVTDWKSIGVPFSKPDEAYTSAAGLLGGETPILAAAQLVPMAHLYAAGWFRERLGLDEAEELARVRAENDHVAAEAARWSGRAVAFCSVSLRRPWAWSEIERCRNDLGSAGIKIHLAAAGTDLTDPEHLTEVERLVGWAEGEGVPLLVHFDPQTSGLETADVERFATTVLGPHPEVGIQIAHLGGSGGFGPWTQSVLETFSGWLAKEAANGRPRPGVVFDLSAAILEEESEGVPATTDEEAARLGPALRRLGLERVLFATDHPVFAPRRIEALWRERSGLTAEEIDRVLANRGVALAGAAR